jgi:hypothetical protein
VVEELTPNTFKTVFPSRSELQRMIEWGAVQSKDHKAVMIIEESAGGSFFKQALKRVWVQMTGLPEELRDYPTIWAIGTILGVTKDVDMKFTRSMHKPRFQVMVLDLELIPHSVDVVICDFIYELHFKVDAEQMQENPVLLKIDEKDDLVEDGAGKDNFHGSSNMQIDHAGTRQRDGGTMPEPNQQHDNSGSHGTKKMLFQLMDSEVTDLRTMSHAMITELESDDGGVEHPEVVIGSDQNVIHQKDETAELVARDQVKLLAAIPEASPPSRRSKRRVDNADQANLEWAEKLKAAHNLDASYDQGTTDSNANSILHLSKEHIIDNLESIGINLGNDALEVGKSVETIKSRESITLVDHDSKDVISKLFDQEEKEVMEEEEVDKLVLNALCCEIIDEVLDLDSANPLDCKTIPRKKSPRQSQKGKGLAKGTNHSTA